MLVEQVAQLLLTIHLEQAKNFIKTKTSLLVPTVSMYMITTDLVKLHIVGLQRQAELLQHLDMYYKYNIQVVGKVQALEVFTLLHRLEQMLY